MCEGVPVPLCVPVCVAFKWRAHRSCKLEQAQFMLSHAAYEQHWDIAILPHKGSSTNHALKCLKAYRTYIYTVYRMLLLATWFLLALAEVQQCALPDFSSYLTWVAKWNENCLYQGVCVCVCVLSYLPCFRPHRIDFVNCSLFAFHSGLVELSAVISDISVIALPFSVNTRAGLPPSPPWGTICWLYVVYLIENFA